MWIILTVELCDFMCFMRFMTNNQDSPVEEAMMNGSEK